MSMKPILFNTEMVRAILDGRKTVTRRLIKPQPFGYFEVSEKPTYLYDFQPRSERIYPRYQTGDILYVRETYANISDFINYADYEIDSGLRYLYKCDDNGKEQSFIDVGVRCWRPSIHMPKEAARIFLTVKDVRVERLQDMPHDAATKEGIHFQSCPDGFTWKSETSIDCCYINPMGAFRALWNTTASEDWQKFESNPWVWVIDFEKISKKEADTNG